MKAGRILCALICIHCVFLGCRSTENVAQTNTGNESDINSVSVDRDCGPGLSAGANPSALFCAALGYEYVVVRDKRGAERGMVVFPDGSMAGAWDFYRGKAGQEWFKLKKPGYELMDMGRHEGWLRGAVCIDSQTRKQVGFVREVVVKPFLEKGQWPPGKGAQRAIPKVQMQSKERKGRGGN